MSQDRPSAADMSPLRLLALHDIRVASWTLAHPRKPRMADTHSKDGKP